jgi:hypothetical protein
MANNNFIIPNPPPIPFGTLAIAFAANLPNTPTLDKPIKTSELGTPVYSNLVIASGNYTDIYGNVINYPSIEVDTVLFNINSSRTIIKTPIQGLDGTVKEYISDGDSIINIKGIIQGANGVYPFDEVDALISICNAKCALTIVSDYLAALGITNIVIESYSLPQDMGSQSQQVFELNCLSDVNYLIFENQ